MSQFIVTFNFSWKTCGFLLNLA